MKTLAWLALLFAAASASGSPWWQNAVIYEVYPRSFADSDGDGVGDLRGITAHLNYLASLNVDAIWLTPMYPSPQVDFGYDIADYKNVDPQYGTLQDFDRLREEAAKCNIRIILDLVLNHTSDQHPWFRESASSRRNPKADWYVWNDGIPADSPSATTNQRKYEHEGRIPPNNWGSLFGGSAWEWNGARHQFYYHRFYRQQPDLNWRNPAVEAAMFDIVRFWLDRGVAGFRLDAITMLLEDEQLRNERETGGVNGYGDPKLDNAYTDNLPGVHQIMQRLRAMVDQYPGDRVLIGETYLPNTRALLDWYGTRQHPELHLAMDMMVGFNGARLDAPRFRQHLIEAETGLDGHPPLFVFDNHDRPRSIDRFGDGAHDVAIAKLIASILYASRDAALTYYGAEIGMRTTVPTRVEDVKDPIGLTGWPKVNGRDGERTPMQWTGGPQAGFSSSPGTWLAIPADYKSVNVAAEENNRDSLLRWNESLLRLRRTHPALQSGSMTMLKAGDDTTLAFMRSAPGGEKLLVVLNLSGHAATATFDPEVLGGTVVETLLADGSGIGASNPVSRISLPPYASLIGTIAR